MRLFRRILILLPNLNTFIRLTRNQPQASPIKRRAVDTRFRVQGPALRQCFRRLKVISRLIIPKEHCPVIAAAKHDAVIVDSEGVDNRVLARKVLYKFPLWALPLHR
jgi:hypothetical protein